MRFTLAALVLPALVAAQAQKPLGDQVASWFDKAKGFLPSGAQGVLDSGAAQVAKHQLTELTTKNWETVLAPADGPRPETWMVLVTGNNRTCAGRCVRMETEFNKTVALLATDRAAPRFGILNCDNYAVLCSTWLAGPPSLWYMHRPAKPVAASPGTPLPPTPIHVLHLNVTNVTAKEIVALHKEKGYLRVPPMDSWFHPFDGQLAQYGINKLLGYVLFTFSMIPSWGLMIAVSFITRQFMNSRIGNADAARRAREFQSRPLGGAPAADGR